MKSDWAELHPCPLCGTDLRDCNCPQSMGLRHLRACEEHGTAAECRRGVAPADWKLCPFLGIVCETCRWQPCQGDGISPCPFPVHQVGFGRWSHPVGIEMTHVARPAPRVAA